VSWGLRLTFPPPDDFFLNEVPFYLCEGGWLELGRAVQLVTYPTREEAARAGVELALLRSLHPDTVGAVGVVEYAEEEGKCSYPVELL